MNQTTYIIIVVISLILIIEGIWPFISPRNWRKVMKSLIDKSDRTLHIIGFVCMLVGVILLFITHHYFF